MGFCLVSQPDSLLVTMLSVMSLKDLKLDLVVSNCSLIVLMSVLC